MPTRVITEMNNINGKLERIELSTDRINNVAWKEAHFE